MSTRSVSANSVCCDVEDLGVFLPGTWRVRRRLVSASPAQSGWAYGRAVIDVVDDELHYLETLTVNYADYQGHASRRYRYCPNPSGTADVLFADGRFFHTLDLRRGRWRAEHLCSCDVYVGSFRVLDPDRWLIRWRVRGPHKELRITTLLEREVTNEAAATPPAMRADRKTAE